MLLVTKAHHSSQVSPKEWGLGYGPWVEGTAGREEHLLMTLRFILFLSLSGFHPLSGLRGYGVLVPGLAVRRAWSLSLLPLCAGDVL